ncbi:hypothetical protein PR048_008927 [Dryococelus australis]|uniref:Reverse transcriptase/retrotransposon-derived protein RNase H-like domain-containing protein n=1 Tax=Dryococelus australis TaxID=614101 RepID=A0ABQ9HYG3_9NEOP|nr:hypothetical protein PR048_008927 [Dryococelus australis]
MGDQWYGIKLQLDTGATCDVISFKDYKAIIGMEHARLENSRIQLECYNGKHHLEKDTSAKPVQQPPRRYPIVHRPKIRRHERQLTYMGHVLSGDGLKADPHKVQAIEDMQPPTIVKDLQLFLRMVNYLSKFLPSLATLSELLRQLTRHDTTWVGGSAQPQAFVNVKTTVSTTPVLQYYVPQEPVELQVDASRSGLGAALLHDSQ